jgi:hypothetical protein
MQGYWRREEFQYSRAGQMYHSPSIIRLQLTIVVFVHIARSQSELNTLRSDTSPVLKGLLHVNKLPAHRLAAFSILEDGSWLTKEKQVLAKHTGKVQVHCRLGSDLQSAFEYVAEIDCNFHLLQKADSIINTENSVRRCDEMAQVLRNVFINTKILDA